jgi:large subunit ribosomal protein L29
MKIAEIRELNADELSAQIAAAQKELFESRFKHSMHQLDDTDVLRRLRHRIAQLKTVLNQKSGQAINQKAQKA